MSFKTRFAALAATALMTLPAFADEAQIKIQDAYARASNTMAGAAFMQITNHADSSDRLVSATSDISKRVELHTHKETGDGVMKMVHVEEGFEIPAHGTHHLKRGADHVMFMGLNAPLEQGDTVTVTLSFEKAGDITVEIPVDLERQDGHGGKDHKHEHNHDDNHDDNHKHNHDG